MHNLQQTWQNKSKINFLSLLNNWFVGIFCCKGGNGQITFPTAWNRVTSSHSTKRQSPQWYSFELSTINYTSQYHSSFLL